MEQQIPNAYIISLRIGDNIEQVSHFLLIFLKFMFPSKIKFMSTPIYLGSRKWILKKC